MKRVLAVSAALALGALALGATPLDPAQAPTAVISGLSVTTDGGQAYSLLVPPATSANLVYQVAYADGGSIAFSEQSVDPQNPSVLYGNPVSSGWVSGGPDGGILTLGLSTAAVKVSWAVSTGATAYGVYLTLVPVASGGSATVSLGSGPGTATNQPIYVSCADGGTCGGGGSPGSPFFVQILGDGGPLVGTPSNPNFVQILGDGGALATSTAALSDCVGTETAVSTTDTAVPTSALSARKTIEITNYGLGTIWCSESSGVTVNHGRPINPMGSWALDTSDAVTWYCISLTAQTSGQDTWTEECK